MAKERIKKFVGGQAVIEGVMMRGPGYTATAVREPSGSIVVQKEATTSIQERYPILKKPFLRGCIALYESLVIGMKALSFSAKAAGDEEEEMSNSEIAITMVFSTLFAIALFVALPTFVVKFIPGIQDNHFILNLVEGAIRLALFLLYIWGIGLTKDIQRVFQYHGAEHKTIACFESGKELTVENVRPCTRLHKRCGTSFLLFVMLISMIVFFFVRTDVFWLRLITRICLVPFIAGISYEVIRWAGNSESSFVKIVSAPGLCLQKLTTAEPDASQIECAIAAMKGVLEDEPEE